MELTAFLLPATLATFSLAFAIVWRYGSKPALWWMIAYAAQGAAYLGEIVPTVFHRTIDTLLVDAIFVLGFVGFGQATALFFRWPRRLALNIGLAVAVCAVDGWQIFVADSLKGEILTVDWGLAALALVPFLCDLRAVPAKPVDRAMVAAAGLTVLNCTVISSLFAIFGDAEAGFDAYMSSGYVAWSYPVTTFLNVVVPLVQLAAVALRAIADHRAASEVDLLTGLLNRRGFGRACTEPGASAGAPPRRGFALACDIDHFKAVNDTCGHAVGDAVIVALAGAIRSALPEGAFAARFGGEEFVAFLPGDDLDAAVLGANAMLSAFTAEVARALPIPHPVTASLGLAAVASLDVTMHGDLQRADRALYAAKQAGRNRIVVDPGAQGGDGGAGREGTAGAADRGVGRTGVGRPLRHPARNLLLHGVGFEAARLAFRDPFALDWRDDRADYGEDRFVALASVEGRILCVVYTERSGAIRIISARGAEPHERRRYHANRA